MMEETLEAPFSSPVAAPAYGRPPYEMQEARVVLVTCRVDAKALRTAVPAPLDIVEEETVSFFIGDMLQLPHCGWFHEGGAMVTARYGDVQATYTPYLWTSTDEALMIGREVFGMPKVMCDDTPLRTEGNQVLGTVVRRGEEILRLGVNIEERVDPDSFPRKNGRLTLRTLPGVSESPQSFRQLLHIPLEAYEIVEAWRGRGFASIQPTAYSKVHELTPVEVVDCFYARTRWTLNTARVLRTEGKPEVEESHGD